MKEAVDLFPTGLVIVTGYVPAPGTPAVPGTVPGGRPRRGGCTAAWFAKVSQQPLLVMVALTSGRHTYGVIMQSGCFGVNVVGKEQVELARKFGLTSSRTTDKFQGIAWETLSTGSPFLPGASSWIDCKLVHTYPAGDHFLLVGEVVAGKVFPAHPPYLFRKQDFFP